MKRLPLSPRPPFTPSRADAQRQLTTTIRSVVPADLEALHELDAVCFEPGIAYSRGELRRFLGLATAEALVAEESGMISGFAIGYLSGRRIGHVVTLDVRPARRRGGLGELLLEALLARLARAGAREGRLEVSTENGGAIGFYENLGFQTRRRLRDYYGPGRDALEMKRAFQVSGPTSHESTGKSRP
jgi:ribosomal-protein-alanine N-acetyltransferase